MPQLLLNIVTVGAVALVVLGESTFVERRRIDPTASRIRVRSDSRVDTGKKDFALGSRAAGRYVGRAVGLTTRASTKLKAVVAEQKSAVASEASSAERAELRRASEDFFRLKDEITAASHQLNTANIARETFSAPSASARSSDDGSSLLSAAEVPEPSVDFVDEDEPSIGKRMVQVNQERDALRRLGS